MRTTKHLPFAAATVLALPFQVHAQGFLRAFPSEPGLWDHPTLVLSTSDGGVLYRYGRHPQQPLVKFSASGTVEWAREIGPAPFTVNAWTATPDGGAVIIGRVQSTMTGSMDSSYFPIFRIGPSGDVLWSRSYTVHGWEDGVDPPLVNQVLLARDADGNMFALFPNSHTSHYDGPCVMKFGPDGTLYWATDLRNDASDWDQRHVYPDHAGGCMVVSYPEYLVTDGILFMRLDASGGLLWRKKVRFYSTAYDPAGANVLPLPTGIHVAGALISSNASSLFFAKLAWSGILEWMRIYPMVDNDFPPSHSGTNEDAVQLPDGNLRFGHFHRSIFTPDGELLERKRCLGWSFDDGTHYHHFFATAHGFTTDHLTVRASLLSTHNILQTHSMLPVVGRIPIEPELSCAWVCEDQPVAQGILAPNSFAGIEPEWGPDPIVLSFFDGPIAITSTPVVIPADEDLCEYLVLLGMGLEESAAASPSVRPNPVHAGEPIRVNAPGAVSWEVFNAAGQRLEVEMVRTNDGLLAGTGTLAAGLYTLRLAGQDGRPLGTVRFVVH